MTEQRHPVGIDLGTTFSSAAWLNEDGRPEVLRFTDDGSSLASTSHSIASAVYFKTEDEVIVGNKALEFSLLDASRVARAFKRQIGKEDYRFSIDGRSYRAEELSALVLRRIKEGLEERIGPVDDVVISVPYVFNQRRREATRQAGQLAGFKKVDLIDEPVAAALAYGQKLFYGGGQFDYEELNELFTDEVVLVYDLGGGTFDATIMRLGRDNVFKVLATEGDEQLGGEDWDDVLLQHVCQAYREVTRIDPTAADQINVLQELRLKTVEAKKSLSDKAQTTLRFTHEGQDHEVPLNRGDFQASSRHLLDRTSNTVQEMLEKADQGWSFIDRVLVVGGASRMPMVGSHMQRVMNNRQFDMSVSPDTAIAEGAAVYAGLQSGRENPAGIEGIETVNSHALGLQVKDRDGKVFNDVLIRANERTGRIVSRTYVLQSRRAVSLTVLEGDHEDPQNCVELGEVRAFKLPPGLRKEEPFKVSFEFRENGLLKVEGRIPNPDGGPPLRPQMDVVVAGVMSHDETETAIATLRGISID